MLGCHDFCGYYEWTFHYVRRRWGKPGVERLWREAIGGDSQQHYAVAGADNVLRRLFDVWNKTGEDEHCDWTWTLDEEKNLLRWDMEECPSKGHLIQNDLNADEDYCDHCMGWAIPVLDGLGVEVLGHEHNHCGQCWATMRVKDRPSDSLPCDRDIRNDPRWRRGFLDRWAHSQRLPVDPSLSPSSDPCEVIESWFRSVDISKLSDSGNGGTSIVRTLLNHAILASDTAYNSRELCPSEARGVVIGCPPADLAATAARYDATARESRPMLLHAYLPGVAYADFVSAGLPRPMPLVPLLIRKGVYTHQPRGPHPTTDEFVTMLAAALGKNQGET